MKKECDIVVIGGGGSGLVAGCRAASLGKKVVVLEKTDGLGGGMNGASTMRTFGSKWQKERGIENDTAQYLRNRMDECYWRLDRKFTRSVIEGTGKFFDWFCEVAPQEAVDKFYPGRYVFDEDDGPIGPQCGGPGKGKGGGRVIVEVCSEKLQELGGEILMGAVPDEVVVSDGKVTGIKGHVGDEELEISCSAVIISCGAWIRNPEVVERVYPKLAASIPGMGESPHMNRAYTGDGLVLAEKAGALMDESKMTIRMMGPMTMCRSRVMGEMSASAYSIYVGPDGKRYICEGSQLRMGIFNSGIVQMEQTLGQTWIIFDENNLRHAIEAGENQPQPEHAMPMQAPHFPATMEEAKADMVPALAANDGVIFSANSIEELAEKTGIDCEGLKETIAAYNEACETGMDWDCYKPASWLAPMNEAPYYAVKAQLGTDGAFGGVEVDENMRVKAKNGGVIGGLYATGDIANGRFISLGGVKMQFLNDMSFALSSGYIAGTDAAESN